MADLQPFENGLIVFLVGEQPTRGINQDQWLNAIHWIALQAAKRAPDKDDPSPLRILGPGFSGSLPSLERNLQAIYGTAASKDSDAARLKAGFPSARILSGSVRSCSSIRWFQGKLQSLEGNTLFDTFQENDDVLIDRFLRYLKGQGTEGKDVAIISEDETAYANPQEAEPAPVTPKQLHSCEPHYSLESRPLHLSYPRDISALRTAYDKQSIFNTSSSTQHTARRILQQSDDDLPDASTNNGDTVPAFSGDVTPVAEEAVLYGIVSYLRTHHTRFLLLRCSNQLDFLFLTRFFHQAYPEGRIVTVGTDLLFRREIDSTEFRGVMALSTYPLLPNNQHWSALFSKSSEGTPGHTHRVFEDGNQEGEYIAARYLFWDPGPGSSRRDLLKQPLPFLPDIPDSADPFWLSGSLDPGRETHAPAWLGVVGRDGYWPIAVLIPPKQESVSSSPPTTIAHITTAQERYETDPGHLDRANHSLYLRTSLSWKLATIAAAFLLLYQIFAVMRGSALAGYWLFFPFRSVVSIPQAVLLGLNCVFASMLLLAPLSILWVSPRMFAHDGGVMTASAVAFIALAALLDRVYRRLPRTGFLCLAATLATFIGISAAALHSSLSEANSQPLTDRIAHLTSGISPLLPVLFLFLGFYLWSWQTLAGNSLLCCGRPMLPGVRGPERALGWLHWPFKQRQVSVSPDSPPLSEDDPCLCDAQYRISQTTGNRILYAAAPFSVPPLVLIPCVSVLSVILLCFSRDLPLLTMEGRAFALCINLGLLAACLLTTAEAARLFTTWTELKRLLTALDQTRLRRTFARLRAVDAQSLWSVSGNVGRVQFHFFSEQLDAASRLLRLSSPGLPGLAAAVLCGHHFVCESAAHVQTGPRWEEPLSCLGSADRTSIRHIFSNAVAEILNKVLIPAWEAEKSSLNLGESAGLKAADTGASPTTMPLSEDQSIRTAEEFVCLHYIAFIQNVLARMRSMVLSMATLFVAVCLAISFYPFVPRTEIGIWMLANLLVIGGSVLHVYAAMERDATLSHIASSEPGRLGRTFWLKSAGFLTAPILGILTTQFPSIADTVLAWVQPGLDAISR